jgi:hypothetical protein
MNFAIGLIVRGLTAFLTRLLVSLASEQMIAWVFFRVADAVVKSTATDKDDQWLEKLREVYQSK